MGIVDFLLRRSSAYKLRRTYDKLREKADKIHNINQRIEILRMLDQLDPSIVSFEEHQMSHYEKKKTKYFIESNMRKVKFLMGEAKNKSKKDKKGNYLKDESRSIR
ncbi:MAG TPA: hypothetical protein VJB05_02310 [archaeon]|nr:hypothetical protein [archaeon]